MLAVSEAIKDLYKNDGLPEGAYVTPKGLTLTFDQLHLTIGNDQIDSESFALSDSLFSDPDMRFGACESACLTITIADIADSLEGERFTVKQWIQDGDSTYNLQIGVFTVDSVVIKNDKRLKYITAYDNMSKFDKDISLWYQGINFPVTKKDLRTALCAYCGVEENVVPLPNDNMLIQEGIDGTGLIGRELLEKIEELDGAFGHIGRDGRLNHVVLSTSVVDRITSYMNDDVEDFIVPAINKVQIKGQDSNFAVSYGTGDNPYLIEGNYLTYGVPVQELETVAANAYLNMSGCAYTAFSATVKGLPYIDVGDFVSLPNCMSFVFQRSFNGIQALKDNFSATGNKTRSSLQTSKTLTEAVKAKLGLLFETAVKYVDLSTSGATEINGDNIYTGIISSYNYYERDPDGDFILDEQGNKVVSGEGCQLNLKTGLCKFSGSYMYEWLDQIKKKHEGTITLDNGRIKLADDTVGQQVYISHEGISTALDASNASGIIDLRSGILGDSSAGNKYSGITVQTNASPILLRSKSNQICIAPNTKQAVYDPSDKTKFDKFIFSQRTRYKSNGGDIDYSNKIADGDGTLYYGSREWDAANEEWIYYCGLRFSANGDKPCIKVVSGDGSTLAPVHASNMPRAVKSIKKTLDENGRIKKMLLETSDGVSSENVTIDVEYDTDGSIIKVGDTTIS